MLNKPKAHLALLATNIFFAINFTAVKYLIDHGFIRPFGLNIVRIGVTAILLWVLFLFKKERTDIFRNDWKRFGLCAFTGIAVNQLLFIKGLSLTFSIHASLLMLTTPLLITLIAAMVLRERLTNNKILGLVLGVAGATVLIMGRGKSANANNVLLGDVLVLINAISYTLYFILVKPLMVQYNPITVIRMIFTIGFFMALPFCWQEFTQIPWKAYDQTAIVLLLLIVFCGTFLAYLFNVYGIRELGASVSGSYIYSQPVFAAGIAMLFLHEALTIAKLVSALLIFTGVFLATKTSMNARINAGK